MTRRSYLARIAKPIAAADPVLWSTPRAAPEESRQTIPALAHTAPRATTVTSAAPAASIDIAALESVADHVLPSIETSKAPPPVEAQPVKASVATMKTMAATSKRPSQVPRPPDRRDAVLIEDAATDEPAPLLPTKSRTISTIRQPADRNSETVSPDVVSVSRTNAPSVPDRQSAPVATPEPRARAQPIATSETPKLHIGAIEIRVSQPPPVITPQPAMPPAPAAPPASAPISRGYESRFGLAQG